MLFCCNSFKRWNTLYSGSHKQRTDLLHQDWSFSTLNQTLMGCFISWPENTAYLKEQDYFTVSITKNPLSVLILFRSVENDFIRWLDSEWFAESCRYLLLLLAVCSNFLQNHNFSSTLKKNNNILVTNHLRTTRGCINVTFWLGETRVGYDSC